MQFPTRTHAPDFSARRTSSPTNRLLPTPASPPTMTAFGSPAAALVRAAESCSNSSVRPRNGALRARPGTTSVLPQFMAGYPGLLVASAVMTTTAEVVPHVSTIGEALERMAEIGDMVEVDPDDPGPPPPLDGLVCFNHLYTRVTREVDAGDRKSTRL